MGTVYSNSGPAHKYITNNGLTILCYKGDVTEADADGIVTSENCGMSNPSKVTEALLKKTNIHYHHLREYTNDKYGTNRLSSGKAYCLETYNYGIQSHFKFILLAMVWPYEDAGCDETHWKSHTERLYRRILEKADYKGLTTLAVPLLGSGKAGVPCYLAVDALITAVSQYRPNNKLTTVLLVSLDEEVLNEILKQWVRNEPNGAQLMDNLMRENTNEQFCSFELIGYNDVQSKDNHTRTNTNEDVFGSVSNKQKDGQSNSNFTRGNMNDEHSSGSVPTSVHDKQQQLHQQKHQLVDSRKEDTMFTAQSNNGHAHAKTTGLIKITEYVTHNGLNIICYNGDITEVDADGIVTSDKCGMPKPSMVTEALLKKANTDYDNLRKCTDAKYGTINLKTGKAYCLETYNYGIQSHFKFILLAIVWPYEDIGYNKTRWKSHTERLYRRILEKADNKGLKSLAVPLLESGKAGVLREVAVDALITALSQYRPIYNLTTVLLVSLNQQVLIEVSKQCDERGLRAATHDTRYPVPNQDRYEYDGNVNQSEMGSNTGFNSDTEANHSAPRWESDYGYTNLTKEQTSQGALPSQAFNNRHDRTRHDTQLDQTQRLFPVLDSTDNQPTGMFNIHVKEPATRRNTNKDAFGSVPNGDNDKEEHLSGPAYNEHNDGQSNENLFSENAKEQNVSGLASSALNNSQTDENLNTGKPAEEPITESMSREGVLMNPECDHTSCTQSDKTIDDSKPHPSNIKSDVLKGDQPDGKMAHKVIADISIPGYEGHGVIVVDYYFEDGIQTSNDDKGYQYSKTKAPLPNPNKNHCSTPNPGNPQFSQGNYNPHHNQSWVRGRSNMSHGNPYRNQPYSSTNQPSNHNRNGEYLRRTQDKPRPTQVHSSRSNYTDSRHSTNRSDDTDSRHRTNRSDDTDSRHRTNRSVSSNEPPVMLLTEDYVTNNGLQIICYVGDVTRADAEGIVTGEGYGMTEPSMVTKSLCDLAHIHYDALGHIVASMCGTTYLTCGEVYCLDTKKYGIDLDFTHVFLAVVLRFRRDHDPYEWQRHMVELYTEIFDEAEAHGVKSIAVPLLGSGRAGAPPCIAVTALVRSLSKQTPNRLRKVLLVSIDQAIHSEIVKQWKEYFAEESEVETRKVLANFVAERTHAHNQKKNENYGNAETDHNGKNYTEKDSPSKPTGHASSNSNHSSATGYSVSGQVSGLQHSEIYTKGRRPNQRKLTPGMQISNASNRIQMPQSKGPMEAWAVDASNHIQIPQSKGPLEAWTVDASNHMQIPQSKGPLEALTVDASNHMQIPQSKGPLEAKAVDASNHMQVPQSKGPLEAWTVDASNHMQIPQSKGPLEAKAVDASNHMQIPQNNRQTGANAAESLLLVELDNHNKRNDPVACSNSSISSDNGAMSSSSTFSTTYSTEQHGAVAGGTSQGYHNGETIHGDHAFHAQTHSSSNEKNQVTEDIETERLSKLNLADISQDGSLFRQQSPGPVLSHTADTVGRHSSHSISREPPADTLETENSVAQPQFRPQSNEHEDVKHQKPEEQKAATPVPSEPEICVICMDAITNPKTLHKCGHTFCTACIDECFNNFKPVCPTCNTVYGALQGNQPDGTMHDRVMADISIPGYDGYGAIVIDYRFQDGIQTEIHPNPGKPYHGTRRRAFLPNNSEGKSILKLLRKAFDQKLTFTIGRSTTTGREDMVTWNDIHHKTNTDGGPTRFGYPDPTYLSRVRDELASKGVTEN